MERFEKIKNLGRGAQGTVILVRRKVDSSYFVIKRILVEDVGMIKTEQSDLATEIAVLSSVSHPNIIGYHGSFVEDGVMNVVMEYADNGSLFQHVQRAQKPFSEEVVVSFFVQLLLALQHLHKRKILHRDIKTKNVFVTKEQKIKLGDFGLSKMLDASASYAQSAVGTPYYLSPELCEGKQYNHKSDVWALGCLIYELCTFRHAFDATSLPALVMSIIRGEVEPIQHPYSPALVEAIRCCLRKDPETRPSVEELLAMDVLRAEAQRQVRSIDAEMASVSGVERPLFTAGHVEMVLTQRLKSARGMGSGESEYFTQDKILSELEEEEEFLRLLQSLRNQLDIKDRMVNRMMWFKCFYGKDLIDYLVQELCIDDRQTGVMVGQRWMDAGVFYHVAKTEMFADADKLYRFDQDEITTILNMKEVLQGPAQPAEAVVRYLEAAVDACVRGFTQSEGTLMDYEGLAMSEAYKLWVAQSQELQRIQTNPLPYNTKIAMLINLYNILCIHGFIAIGPPQTSQQRRHFWSHTAYALAGHVFTLQDIHHGILRANRKPPNTYLRVFGVRDERARIAAVVWDPRIHFALNHGTKGSPPLRVFRASTLDRDLDDAARAFLTRNVEIQTLGPVNPLRAEGTLKVALPSLLETFSEDFGGDSTQMLRWVAQYLPQKDLILDAISRGSVRIKFREDDTTLNKLVRPAPPGGSGTITARRVPRGRKAHARMATPDRIEVPEGSQGSSVDGLAQAMSVTSLSRQ